MTKARDLANSAAAFAAVSATELAFVDGVTSAIQTQIDAKAPSSTAVTLTGTQTLTNKTLTSPALTTPTISTATTNGDILYGTGSGALSRLGIGSTNQTLGVTGGVPAYQASSKSTLTTTGDVMYASAANTPARLGIGSTSQVLTVAGGIPTWATVSTGAWTQAATGSLTGASVTISSLSGQKYYVFCKGWSSNGTQPILVRLNGDTGSNYYRGDSSGGETSIPMFGSVGVNSAATLSQGCFIDMANTSMSSKPVMTSNGINTTNGSQGGWYNSASTITSITLFPNGADFDAGTYYVWSFA